MRASEDLRRSVSLVSRTLPPLDAIRRSVERVSRRWPDAVRTPEDRDRERLALAMLKHVRDWDWTGTTTQRVISAAIAIFDSERCARPDLEIVRDFYFDEAAKRPPGAFLDGILRVYIDSFSSDAPHTLALARALGTRREDFGPREQKLIAALPGLLTPTEAPNSLADLMLEADDPYQKLKEIGLPSPHLPGLVKAAHEIFVEKIGPKLRDENERQRMFRWLTPTTGATLQTGAGPAIEALLAAWRTKTPPETLRQDLCETIIAAYNDPRLHNGGIWSGFDPDLKKVLLRWLTKQDMKFFCDMVTATQDNHMWPPRRDFWLQLYEDKMIDEAWVAFGSSARRYAQTHLVRSGRTDIGRRFGSQLDRGGSTSLLIMRIGNKIVVDGCHSYKTHIFRMDDPKAPKLYQRQYYCNDIMRASRNSKPHNSIPAWSQWVMQHV
ncbi:hypothetical protein D6850_04960 [Roseovarius spongiae]|uniref:Zorya protein ZorC EH domain-containing protein n=1 Tax=Roseovarius spongiae TaxID=2320272 RepID=A0A3A8AWW7_9RHOB|nr:EH signature domain-containing protein [Roseovarius spongiae]RKF16883.1 hypothetical protein D6850_04960 [Roseovarius spongiae]